MPFGDDFAESGTREKHHFTSYERDAETGNDYAVNRAYAPLVGKFLSADPFSPRESTTDPRGWNRYSYTRNVVINRSDPLGLFDGPIGGAGCPPAGTPGTWPGRCLCQIVPSLCSGGMKPTPPNVDGYSSGPGGAPQSSAVVAFKNVKYSGQRILFDGLNQAAVDIKPEHCRGEFFSIETAFTVNLGQTADRKIRFGGDGGFEGSTAGDFEFDPVTGAGVVILSVRRRTGGSRTGLITIRIEGKGKDGLDYTGTGRVNLKCPRPQ